MRLSKKMKQILEIFLVVTMLFSMVSIFGCVQKENTKTPDDPDQGKEEQPVDPPKGDDEPPVTEPPKYVIQPAVLGENVEIHTEQQVAYLIDEDYDNVGEYVAIPSIEASYPKEIELSWEINDGAASPDVIYQVSVSTSPDMSGAKQYLATGKSYALCNLFIGTTYYWQVSFEEDGVAYESPIASFTTTSQGLRNIRVGGMTNCRDLGGVKTTNGKIVKQGMLYRTGRVDKITAAGRDTMLNELGIKTEIDLYGGAQPLFTGSHYVRCAISDSATLNDLKPYLAQIFEILADESNYPIFFHCVIGTDRTGALAYLINAVLGVSEEDIYRDYCFSNFGNIGVEKDSELRTSSRLYSKVGFYINSQSGSTLQAKAFNYLIKFADIPKETLNKVRRIMGVL